MAKNLGNELNQDLQAKLGGGALYRPGGLGLTVVTLDEAGWPHVAMAPGAVSARPDEVCFALGGQSGSFRNVERDPRVTLMVAGPDTMYYIKGKAAIARREMQIIPQEVALRVQVTEVLQDMESFLNILGGVTYRYGPMHEGYVTVLGALLDELQALAEEEAG